MYQLTFYEWPDNVRELQNAVERAVILAHGGALRSLPSLAKNHRQSALSTANALGWPVNFLCKESENGSTNRPTTFVL